MHLPAVLFGIVVSTLYGAVFHLWQNGGAGRFLLYLILSWIGFWVGHALGSAAGWSFARLGPLHLGVATLSSAIFLLVGHWLSLVEIDQKR